MSAPYRILQIGYGAFGETHLRAWSRLVPVDRVIVADPRPVARAAAMAAVPGIAGVADWQAMLSQVDAVDVLTPTDTHQDVAGAAIDAGKHVFIEKPMTTTAVEAEDLLARATRRGVLVQGGLYFRFHPKAEAAKTMIAAGALGDLRFLQGKFAGFKRARGDSGALLNDAVHFIDLFAWLVGAMPDSVHAVTRDHFGRGFEDLALVTMQWTSGVVAHVETGYVQPGRWPDTVVPGAITSKEIQVSGSAGALEIDFAAETMVHHRVRHALDDGLWRPVFDGSLAMDAPAADPTTVVAREFGHFLDCIATGRAPIAGLAECGVGLGRVLDAARRSSVNGTVEQVAP